MNIIVIGMDLAKYIFVGDGVNEVGKAELIKQCIFKQCI
jgi:hypothetical protein